MPFFCSSLHHARGMYAFDRGRKFGKCWTWYGIARVDFLTRTIVPERLRCECPFAQTACKVQPCQCSYRSQIPRQENFIEMFMPSPACPPSTPSVGIRSISTAIRKVLGSEERTKAFIVPCSACLWFLRNLGSVPFRDGYLEVFGFFIPCLWFFLLWLC